MNMRQLTCSTNKAAWVVLALCLIGLGPGARADLVLNIDAVSDEFWFTGSDSGMMAGDIFGSNTMSWWYPPNPVVSGYSFIGNLGQTFDSSPSTGFQDEALIAYSSGNVAILLDLNYDAGDTIFTFTGNGTKLSYASFNASAETQLEGIVGQELVPFYSGRGWSNIPVAAVPELTSLALVGLAGGLCLLSALRRRG